MLFGNERIAELVEGSGPYRHEFGGPVVHRGARPRDCRGHRMHLLYRLDQSDPLLPFRVPGIERVPLYYCFDLSMAQVGYRCLDDERVKVYLRRQKDINPGENYYPSEDFPEAFPHRSIRLKRIAYHPGSPKDALAYSGIFGLGKLSPRARKTILTQRRKLFEGLFGDTPKSDDELLEWTANPFHQDRPNSRCVNPKCQWNRKPGGLEPICVLGGEPIKGVPLFCTDEDVQIIFEKCRDCHAFVVTNQCT